MTCQIDEPASSGFAKTEAQVRHRFNNRVLARNSTAGNLKRHNRSKGTTVAIASRASTAEISQVQHEAPLPIAPLLGRHRLHTAADDLWPRRRRRKEPHQCRACVSMLRAGHDAGGEHCKLLQFGRERSEQIDPLNWL